MTETVPVTNLEAENASLTRKVAWLERQVKLAEMRVPQNRAIETLKGKSLVDLANLTPEAQSLLFIDVAHDLNSAEKAPFHETTNNYDEIHSLEWNGEGEHPIWKGLGVWFGSDPEDANKSAVIISAVRPDESEDCFAVSITNGKGFNRDISSVMSAQALTRNRFKIEEEPIGQVKVAQLLDFARGVRGGLEVVKRSHLPSVRSSSDD